MRGSFHHPDDEPGNTRNTWHAFQAGGEDFLVLTCEWGPRNQVVAWMDSVVAAHPHHRAILVVHAYLSSGSAPHDWAAGHDSMNPHSYGDLLSGRQTNPFQVAATSLHSILWMRAETTLTLLVDNSFPTDSGSVTPLVKRNP